MKSNNAPSDWNPTGAAQVSASDSTTLADDLKFALRAMGLREEFAGMGPGEFALALLGGAMATLGCLLLCLGGLMQSFEVPGRFPSLNDYLRIRNPRQRAALKRELDHRVAWAAKEAGVRPVKRFMVRVVWFEPNARRDWDNVRSGIKFVLDGLKKAGIIEDDSQRYLLDTDDGYGHDKSNPHILVQIYEEGDQTWRKRA